MNQVEIENFNKPITSNKTGPAQWLTPVIPDNLRSGVQDQPGQQVNPHLY